MCASAGTRLNRKRGFGVCILYFVLCLRTWIWGICVYVTLQVFASTVNANLEHPFYVVQIRRPLTRQLCLDLCVLDQGMLQRSLGVDLRFLCRACWWGILMPFVASQHILTSRVSIWRITGRRSRFGNGHIRVDISFSSCGLSSGTEDQWSQIVCNRHFTHL